jgi:hypothetical protein
MAVFSEMRKEGISSSAAGSTYSKGKGKPPRAHKSPPQYLVIKTRQSIVIQYLNRG